MLNFLLFRTLFVYGHVALVWRLHEICVAYMYQMLWYSGLIAQIYNRLPFADSNTRFFLKIFLRKADIFYRVKVNGFVSRIPGSRRIHVLIPLKFAQNLAFFFSYYF